MSKDFTEFRNYFIEAHSKELLDKNCKEILQQLIVEADESGKISTEKIAATLAYGIQKNMIFSILDVLESYHQWKDSQ